MAKRKRSGIFRARGISGGGNRNDIPGAELFPGTDRSGKYLYEAPAG